MKGYFALLTAVFFGACSAPVKEVRLEHDQQKAYLIHQTDTLYSVPLSELRENKVVVLSRESGEPQVFWLRCRDVCEVKKVWWWLVLLPPLVAIVLAMMLREVFVSLFVGCVLGLWLLYGMDGRAVVLSVFSFFERSLPSAVGDPEHASVIVFSLLIGGVVNLLSASGDMGAFIAKIRNVIKTRRQALVAGWLSGVVIFFDDYANTLVLGNTLRPVMRAFKVSPEKLAYIIDSTSAPVAAIALISTWIGIELGYIEEALSGLQASAYGVFLQSLKYAFYPVFAVVCVGLVALTGRDIGPMVGAEQRALASKGREREEAAAEEDTSGTGRWWRAPLVVAVLVGVAFCGLMVTGWDADVWSAGELSVLRKVAITLGNADGFRALLWASGISLLVAFLLAIRDLRLDEISGTIVEGFKMLLPAVVVLVLAWSLSEVVLEIGTAEVLTALIKTNVSASLFPSTVFIVSALVSFSTGTSWGTMAMVYPLALPAALNIGDAGLVSQCAAAVLGGAVFGDHCSPISDTTVLSSLASNCNHVEHVRTQMPYAVMAAILALVAYTMVGVGVPWWLLYLAGVAALLFVLIRFGTKTSYHGA